MAFQTNLQLQLWRIAACIDLQGDLPPSPSMHHSIQNRYILIPMILLY